MFQYFLKVVSTQFRLIDGQVVRPSFLSVRTRYLWRTSPFLQVNTHQFSTTSFERDLTEGANGEAQGVHVQHGVSGLPGAFFNYEISPIQVVHSETQQSFAHFLTS